MNTGLYVAAWIMANLMAVGVYDVAAYFCLDRTQSVSFWLQRWFSEWPMLAVGLGVIIGHLCWPVAREARKVTEI